MLLRVIESFCAKFETGLSFEPTTVQHFFCSVLAEAWRYSVGSNCTALPTLLGPRKRITHALQSVMGCILSTMHCRSQHCWTDSVGSCCVRVGSGVKTDATTPNIVGPTMLGVIVSVARSFRPTMHSVGQRRNCCNRLPLDNRLEFLNHICLWFCVRHSGGDVSNLG